MKEQHYIPNNEPHLRSAMCPCNPSSSHGHGISGCMEWHHNTPHAVSSMEIFTVKMIDDGIHTDEEIHRAFEMQTERDLRLSGIALRNILEAETNIAKRISKWAF